MDIRVSGHQIETGEALQAWYRQLCKRPCFHDEYLQAFNSPNTQLIDTDGRGAGNHLDVGKLIEEARGWA